MTISNFLRRLLKGTFPEHESYTFFRSGSHGFPDCIELPAFSVYLSLREKEQRVELLFAAQQCGIPLPQNFVSKMAYAIQLAEAEAQRGKTEMKTKMAPTLGDEVVSEVFKALDILQLQSLPNHPHNLHRNLKALVRHHLIGQRTKG